MAGINPKVLSWARETAGLDIETAARKIGLNAARGFSGAARLAALEAGDDAPSETLLKRMAQQYHRPLTTFYLPYVPRPPEMGEDFRTLPEGSDKSDALLATLLRDVKARQTLVREALEDDEAVTQVAFVGSQAGNADPAELSSALVKAIKFDRSRFRASKTVDDAFNYLRTLIEKVGVYVVLAGDCGSGQTAIDVSIFRGFAIADDLAPFIVINDQDARSAWSFTVLHELAHLLLGASGISGGATPASGLEKLCNDTAAFTLLPGDELDDEIVYGDAKDILLISYLANRNKVSRTMIAYQFYQRGKFTFDRFEELRTLFIQEWSASKAAEKERNRDVDGGPNWYVVRRHRLGTALLDVARRGLADGSLTPVRAARMLGVKPVAVYPLLADTARRARSA